MKDRTLPLFSYPLRTTHKNKTFLIYPFRKLRTCPALVFPKLLRKSVPLPGPPHSRAQEPHSLKNGCAALALPLPKGKYTIEVCFDVANALSHNSD